MEQCLKNSKKEMFYLEFFIYTNNQTKMFETRFGSCTAHASFFRRLLEDVLHLSEKVNPETERQRAQDTL